MTNATNELQKLSVTLTENDKQEIRNQLASKINVVRTPPGPAGRDVTSVLVWVDELSNLPASSQHPSRLVDI